MGSVHLYLFMTTFSAMLFLLSFRDPNDMNANFLLLQSHLSLRLCYCFICFQSIFSIVQIGQCLLFYFPVHWFFFLSFCCLFHSLLVFTLVFVFLSCKISIWFFVIFVYLLTFYFFAESLYFSKFVSSISVIAHWSNFMTDTLKPLLGNSNFSDISMWVSIDCSNSVWGFSWFLVWQVIFNWNVVIWGITLWVSGPYLKLLF